MTAEPSIPPADEVLPADPTTIGRMFVHACDGQPGGVPLRMHQLRAALALLQHEASVADDLVADGVLVLDGEHGAVSDGLGTPPALPPDTRTMLHAVLADAIGASSYLGDEGGELAAWHRARSGDTAGALRQAVSVASQRVRVGRFADGLRTLDVIAEQVGDAAFDPAAGALRARAALDAGDPRAEQLWLEVARAAMAAGDDRGAARALVHGSWAANDPTPMLVEAARIGGASDGWDHLADAIGGFNAEQWPDAIDACRVALARARSTGDQELELLVLEGLASCHGYLGDLDLAASLLGEAMMLADMLGFVRNSVRIRHNLAEVRMLMLDVPGTLDATGELLSFLQLRRIESFIPSARAVHAGSLSHAGRLGEALAQVEQGLRRLDGTASSDDPRMLFWSASVLAATGAASPSQLEPLLERTRSAARAEGLSSYLFEADRVMVAADCAVGDIDGAVRDSQGLSSADPVSMLELALPIARAGTLAPHDGALERVTQILDSLDAQDAELGPYGRLCRTECAAHLARDAEDLSRMASRWRIAGRLLDAARVQACAAAASTWSDEARTQLVLAQHALLELGARADATAVARVLEQRDVARTGSAERSIVDTPLLDGLPPAMLAGAAAAVRTISTKRGRHVDVPAGSLCIIRTGRVRLMRAAGDGRELTVGVLGPGDAFGEESLAISNSSTTVPAEAVEDSVLWVLSSESVSELASRHPEFGTRLLELARDRMADVTELAGDLALATADLRVARLLLRLEQRFGRPTLKGERLIDLRCTNEDIARMVGIRRQLANQILVALRDEGIIEIDKRRVIVHDMAALARRAELAAAA